MEKRDYSEFKNTKVFETGLVEMKPSTMSFFIQNGIETLEDLFSKHDEGKLTFASNTVKDTIMIFISLARAHYLGEDLPFSCAIELKYSRDFWLYTAFDDVPKEYLGKARSNSNSYLTYYGFAWSWLIDIAKKYLKGPFSLIDVLTNQETIDELRSLQRDIRVNRALTVCEYMLRRKRDALSGKGDLSVLSDKEKAWLDCQKISENGGFAPKASTSKGSL